MRDEHQPHIAAADLGGVRCPSLIICGDHDLISITHTVLIYQNIPHAQLWVVPNSGHGTLNDQTEDFNREVNKFFTEPYKVPTNEKPF